MSTLLHRTAICLGHFAVLYVLHLKYEGLAPLVLCTFLNVWPLTRELFSLTMDFPY